MPTRQAASSQAAVNGRLASAGMPAGETAGDNENDLEACRSFQGFYQDTAVLHHLKCKMSDDRNTYMFQMFQSFSAIILWHWLSHELLSFRLEGSSKNLMANSAVAIAFFC